MTLQEATGARNFAVYRSARAIEMSIFWFVIEGQNAGILGKCVSTTGSNYLVCVQASIGREKQNTIPENINKKHVLLNIEEIDAYCKRM